LLQSFVVAMLPMAILATGRPIHACMAFYALMMPLVAYHFLCRHPLELMTLIIAQMPVLLMVRATWMLWVIIAILLTIAISLWLYVFRESIHELARNRLLLALLAASLLYWWLTFLTGHPYITNMRVVELALSAVAICLLGSHRSYLATALVGIAVSSIAIALAFLPFGSRLGMAVIAGIQVGNPILLGLPTALIFLLCIAESGKWLLLQSHPFLRAFMILLSGAILFLSTSRGSWLVALLGAALLFTLGGKTHRGVVLLAALLFCVALAGVLATARGDEVRKYLTRTFSMEESMARRSTGRSEQWAAFPTVFAESPLWGHGPGEGIALTRRYVGRPLQWHSLYLHVGAETGLIGLLCLFAIVAGLLIRGVAHLRRTQEIVPLMCACSFLFIGVSVSGLDPISGVYLGIALLGRNYSHLYRAYFVTVQAEEPRLAPAARSVLA